MYKERETWDPRNIKSAENKVNQDTFLLFKQQITKNKEYVIILDFR